MNIALNLCHDQARQTNVKEWDDEFGIAKLLEAVLSDEGHRVLTASNGQHGLEVLNADKPDVVFLDYIMGDGWQRNAQIDARLAGSQRHSGGDDEFYP